MAEEPRLKPVDDLVDEDTWEYLAPQQPGRPARDSARFLLRAAQAFHAYGYSAERLEELLDHLSRSLQIPAQFFTAHTGLLVSFGHQERQRTFLLRVSPGEQDLGKLVDLEAVVARVLSRAMSPNEGSEAIDQILAAPSPYGPVVTVAAYAISTAAASRMLGGGLNEIAVASLIGLLLGLLAQATSGSPRLGRLFEPMAAFLAALVASTAAVASGRVSVYIATLSGLIIILPGLTLTLALAELSSRHLVSGTARLSGAFMVFLALAFGVALATKLVSLVATIPRYDPVGLPDWTVVAALVVIPLGFTVLLRAHLRDTPWILLAGALGFGASRVGAVTLGPELATFLGALTVGTASNLYGRVLHRPEAVTLIPGILLLVPGSIGFRSLSWLLEREVVIGVESAFAMILLAAGLVAGLLVANVVVPPRR